jgi:hypothetical protein
VGNKAPIQTAPPAVLTSIVNAHENSQVIDSAADCVYDIFAAAAEDFAYFSSGPRRRWPVAPDSTGLRGV